MVGERFAEGWNVPKDAGRVHDFLKKHQALSNLIEIKVSVSK
jgi:hypothetical protein